MTGAGPGAWSLQAPRNRVAAGRVEAAHLVPAKPYLPGGRAGEGQCHDVYALVFHGTGAIDRSSICAAQGLSNLSNVSIEHIMMNAECTDATLC